MKKARFLFVLCLVAALALGMALTAGAVEMENTDIGVIHITMDQPEAGEPIPEGALTGYTVVAFDQYGSELKEAILLTELSYLDGGHFWEYTSYNLDFLVMTNPGYKLGSNVQIVLNDTPVCTIIPDEYGLSHRTSDVWVYCYGLERTDIAVDTLPAVEVGKTIEEYSYNDPNGAYTLSGTWYVHNYETNAVEPASGTFENGKLYQLKLTAKASSGWGFHGPYLTIKDPQDSYRYEYYTQTYNDKEMNFAISVPCGAMESVDYVEVVGAPESVTAGAAISDLTLSAKYENVNIASKWLDADGNAVSGTFEDGKVYYLELTITPKAGYYLNSWLQANSENQHLGSTETDGTVAVVRAKYSLQPKVTQVDITGVTDAVIGQAPTTEGIKVPDGVNYMLDYAYWENQTNWEDEMTVFADGNKYILYIQVSAQKGYEFTEDTILTINGEVVDTWNTQDEWLYVGLEYSFLDVIDKVDITVPAPEIGQTASLENIVLPQGVILNTESSRWYEEVTIVGEDGNYGIQQTVTGAFLKGHKYYLQLEFHTEAGYEFAEDAVITINGVELDAHENAWGYVSETYGHVQLMYSFREIINKVEITGVTAPTVGQTATTEGITINGVGEYEIYWREEAAETEEPFTGTFENGKAYYLYVNFDSAEGTEFAENCTITVNGEVCDNGYAGGEGGNVWLRYSFKTVIDKVEFLGMPQFSVGGIASTESVKAPEGANYTIMSAWMSNDDEGGDNFTGTFEADGIYMLVLYAEPKEGYEFADDLQILVDGKAPATNMIGNDDSYAVAQYYYVPSYQPIGKVELTVKNPVIGDKIDNSAIKAPEGVHYTLTGEWFVSEDGENWRTARGVFEEGKYYALRLYVETRGEEEMYWFGNQAQISLNGVDVVWDNDENYAGAVYAYVTCKVGKLCNHTYGTWTSASGNVHSQTCSKCGDTVTENHVWTDSKDDACDTCGYDRSDNPPTGDAVIPACLLALCSVTALVVIHKRRNAR